MNSDARELLHVGITRDFLEQTRNPWEMGLSWVKSHPGIAWSWLDRDVPEVEAGQIRGLDAVIAWKSRWTQASLAEADRLLLIARWGVGVDHVDLQACTDAGVMVTITPNAVRRPVATANVTMLLALSTRLLNKDRDTRAGVWQSNCLSQPGPGLYGKKLGSIGFGNIAKETFRLLSGFDMRFIAYSPHANAADASELRVELRSLEEVIRDSDYLMINCPLTADTRHMLGAEQIAGMKDGACLINLSRGAIVDQAALTKALREGKLAGAGLDVFEQEPLPPGDELSEMDQVILAPHALALTHDLYRGMEHEHRHIMELIRSGRIPSQVINREVLNSSLLLRKMSSFLLRSRGADE